MRTVTFSDKAVIDAVGATCMSMWINRVPEFHNCEFETEKWILEKTPEAFPTRNFCTYFCTPDGKVLHYFTGYYCPKAFLAEVEFVETLRQTALDDSGAIKMDTFRRLHGERIAARRENGVFSVALDDLNPNPDKAILSRSLREGARHLDEVNDWMNDNGPPDLKDAMKEHLSGNRFSEEGSGTRKRGK